MGPRVDGRFRYHINCKRSLRSGTVINTVQETKTCPDGTRMCLKQACVVETGHLTRCHAQVEDCEFQGKFLFEPTISLSNEN